MSAEIHHFMEKRGFWWSVEIHQLGGFIDKYIVRDVADTPEDRKHVAAALRELAADLEEAE